jgi:DNA-binding MarR family transcriptional regulator
MNRDRIDSVLRSLRRVNLQGSFFGQTVAIRFGLSESDIETLEALIDMGASTAGRLAEVTGLTSGAVTRVIDRLEHSGYVRRVPDPADRRRVIVEVVPDKVAGIRSALDRIGEASAREIGRYTDAQLSLIADFLTRMEQVTRDEATVIRENPDAIESSGSGSAEHSAPLGGLTTARLHVRSGLSELRLRPGKDAAELYRATFEGATPQVRLRDGRVVIHYRGLAFDWRKRSATIGLNPTIPWSLEILGGVQKVEADLRSVRIEKLELVGGTERVQLELARPSGDVPVRIVGGMRSLRLERPADVPVRLTAVGGVSAATLDGMRLDERGGRATIASSGFEAASDRYTVEVVGGSKSIDIVGRPV